MITLDCTATHALVILSLIHLYNSHINPRMLQAKFVIKFEPIYLSRVHLGPQNHSRTPKSCLTLGLECFGHIRIALKVALYECFDSPKCKTCFANQCSNFQKKKMGVLTVIFVIQVRGRFVLRTHFLPNFVLILSLESNFF